MRVTASLLLFVSCLSPCQAGQLLGANAHVDDDHYLLHLDMRVKGKSTAIYAVLTDFNHLHLVNNNILSSKLLKSQGRVHHVRVESEGCLWIFCRHISQVDKVTELANGYILSETIAAQSDLKYGRTLWHVIDEGDTTRITYDADFVPDFWVPPIFGPIFLKSTMLEEGQQTINGIETLANQHR